MVQGTEAFIAELDWLLRRCLGAARLNTDEQGVWAGPDVIAQFRRRQSPGLFGPRFNACRRDVGEYVLWKRKPE
jgi:hypothetical protein